MEIVTFQSTLSARRATVAIPSRQIFSSFQSTLSARRATMPRQDVSNMQVISIHALREESDAVAEWSEDHYN